MRPETDYLICIKIRANAGCANFSSGIEMRYALIVVQISSSVTDICAVGVSFVKFSW